MPIRTKSYEYTSANRLVLPHKYMYTKYSGNEFLQNYSDDRSNFLKHFSSLKNYKKDIREIDEDLCALVMEFIDNTKLSTRDHNVDNIGCFESVTEINTSKLLESLIHHSIYKKTNDNFKEWLDFLVQRFEVTKFLFESYHKKKLRVGRGKRNLVFLYWLFSVLLVLVYYQTTNLKYLSTLLKVNDLICSLNDSYLEVIPSKGMDLVLLNEIGFVQNISNNVKRSNFDFK